MINVSELLTDPDFIQAATGTRNTYQIATTGDEAGEAMVTPTQLSFTGALMPLKDQKDVMLLPEGLRNLGGLVIYTNFELKATSGDVGASGPADAVQDVIDWHGDKYALVVCQNWSDYGYYKAIGVIQP